MPSRCITVHIQLTTSRKEATVLLLIAIFSCWAWKEGNRRLVVPDWMDRGDKEGQEVVKVKDMRENECRCWPGCSI
jgi:hypothetical protein